VERIISSFIPLVLLDLGVEEINRYADRWTNLRVIMGEHAIKVITNI